MADEKPPIPEFERERLADDSNGGGIAEAWPPDWMVTYSDMTTILMTFFVLWYALTTAGIDDKLLKMRERDDLDIVRGTAKESRVDVVTESEYRVLTQFQVLPQEQRETVLAEMGNLRNQAEEVMKFVRAGKMEGEVELKVTAEDIVIIPTAPVTFRGGGAEIRKTFYPILDKIAWLLKETGAAVRIEGHTDSTPIHPHHLERYPSNWELSAARAISVANYLLSAGIPADRVSAAAYGDSRPKVADDDPSLRGNNRRVEFHIYLSSDQA